MAVYVKSFAVRILRKLSPPLKRMSAHWKFKAIRQARHNPSAKARVFLTGDLGHLGSRIADLLKQDYEIIGFDLRYSPRENLSNYEYLKERMRGCEYVVHAAAIPHPLLGTIERYVEVNVLGSFNVMRAAAENKVKRFIFISSTAYYGCDINGRLIPAYLPIDEAHPIAAIEGRSEGKLDAYNQSKVMAEQLLAYYGTNKLFQAISLRLAPANRKADQYPADKDWRQEGPIKWRRGCFYSNCHPDFAVQAVKLALEAPGEFWYEAFNIVDKYTHESINVHEFLAKEYPDVPVRGELSPHQSLISPAKAERVLGFKPCEDLR